MVVDSLRSSLPVGERSLFLLLGPLHSLFEYCLDMAAGFPPEQVIEEPLKNQIFKFSVLRNNISSATSYWSYRPTLVQCGRVLCKDMNTRRQGALEAHLEASCLREAFLLPLLQQLTRSI